MMFIPSPIFSIPDSDDSGIKRAFFCSSSKSDTPIAIDRNLQQ